MEKIKPIIIGIIILMIATCTKKPTLEELHSFSATENFPEYSYLETVSRAKNNC
ncbi:MAG: hypothetical protein JKY48_20650 [Flavobacteriales bacterium]|nr:hypothetical protein [Flavobacteriales bacterium]